MRASAPWGVLVVLTAPAPTWALGLGDIELHSALNQPFRADIGLTATNEELETLRVSLASREVFDRSGLDRPAFMSGFEFQLGRNAAGRNVVTVTSRQSVAEPFVTLIVEAAWASGTLQREYTVFLDPPVMLPRSAEPPIAAPRTGISQTPQPAAPIARDPAPAPAPAPATRPQAPAPSPAPRATPPVTTSSTSDGTTYGPVQRAETLWGIAQRYQGSGATTNQTMLAIYEANRDAFGGNINVLRAGTILRIPGRDELAALSPQAATSEVQRQTQAWRAGSSSPPDDRLVLVPPSPADVAAAAGTSRPSATPGTRPGPAGAGASDGEIRRLEAENASLRDELDENRRLLEVRNQELAELQARLGADAAPVPGATPNASSNTTPGVDIEDTQVFADETPPDSAAPPIADRPADVAPPPAVRPTPAATTAPAVVTRRDEPSLVSQIVGWLTSTVGLVAAGVVAILFGALWFMRRRREEDTDDVTGQWDALAAGMDETRVPRPRGEPRMMPSSRQRKTDDDIFGTSSPFVVEERPSSSSTTLPIDGADEIAADHYAQSAATKPSIDDTMSTSAVLNLDEADPVAEADFHMAYGLYDQAAELLTKELRADPSRRDLQLKLLEVYFVWGNKDEFLDAAEHLRSQMGTRPDADWDKVVIMGKQICPDAKLFAASTAGVRGGVDLALGDADGGELDFSLDDDSGDAISLDIGEATSLEVTDGELDLDLTGNRPGFSPTETLDIGRDTAAGLERALLEDDTVEEVSPDAETVAVPKGVDPEMLVATQETPHVTGADDDDIWADFTIDESTLEGDTVEQAGADHPTVESPTLGARQRTAVIGDDIVDEDRTTEMPALSRRGAGAPGTDKTAEIELNDLGLEVDLDDPLGLDDLAAELDTGDTQEQRTIESEAELLSATGITQVLQEQTDTRKPSADDQTKLQAGGTLLGRADVKRREVADTELLERPAPEDEFDLDLDDLSAALSDAETIEQRRSVTDFDFGLSGPTTPVDLDVGETFIGDDEPTGTDDQRGIDPQTLTEVGTKLDLARAYIDMGDPDGARSILDEVISEGDKKQREEAQSLIDALST